MITGLNNYKYVGNQCKNAGDVDGDGIEDLLVGGNNDDDGYRDRTRFFYGGNFRSGETTSITAANVYFSASQGYSNTRHNATPIGDADGDGFADLFVGAYLFSGSPN